MLAALIGAAGFSLAGYAGLAAAVAMPIFGRATRQAEARAAIANRLPPKPLPNASLHTPSLAARVAAITTNDDDDLDLRRLVRGTTRSEINNDLASALASIGVRYDPNAPSEVERAMRPQPFLPPGMPLSPSEPDLLFQLHA